MQTCATDGTGSVGSEKAGRADGCSSEKTDQAESHGSEKKDQAEGRGSEKQIRQKAAVPKKSNGRRLRFHGRNPSGPV